MRQGRRRIVALAALAALGALVAAAVAMAAPRNGGFETGNFSGWHVQDPGGGDWYVYRGRKILPDSEFERGMAPGNPSRFYRPPRGRYAAAAFQNGPGLNILHRVLRAKPGHRNRLSLFLAWRNEYERFHAPNTFDFEDPPDGPPPARQGPSPGPQRNQQFRIDLLKPGAPVRSLEPADILATPFRARGDTPLRRGYEKLRINLNAEGITGRFRLRIAEVDNSAPLLVGVDHVKLKRRPLD